MRAGVSQPSLSASLVLAPEHARRRQAALQIAGNLCGTLRIGVIPTVCPYLLPGWASHNGIGKKLSCRDRRFFDRSQTHP